MIAWMCVCVLKGGRRNGGIEGKERKGQCTVMCRYRAKKKRRNVARWTVQEEKAKM